MKAWGSAAAELANLFSDLFIGPLADLLVHQLQITLTNQIPNAVSKMKVIQLAES